MSYTDPARVEKLEGLLYQCLSTFSAMAEYPSELLDLEHVQSAHDKLQEKMAGLDLPNYQTWKWSADKGHLDWVCKARLYEPEHGTSDTTECECGELNDISAIYCNRCGRRIVLGGEYFDDEHGKDLFNKCDWSE